MDEHADFVVGKLVQELRVVLTSSFKGICEILGSQGQILLIPSHRLDHLIRSLILR